MIFLLGKHDAPVDGVQDYCEYLGQAMEQRGTHCDITHMDWDSEGWVRALRRLWAASVAWRNRWVILQYTALAWSRRGFPFGAIVALAIVKRRGARCAVVFHEPFGFNGARAIDRIRETCQNRVIRKLHVQSELSFFPDPLNTVKWLPNEDAKAIFVPIGSNLPDEVHLPQTIDRDAAAVKTAVIYCLSDPPNLHRELADISHAAKMSAENGTKLRVVFVGRGTAEASDAIERAFDGIGVEVLNLGLQSADEVKRTLTNSDVMLCVRGPLYPRRGSALAGVACGLPIVAYGGAVEGTPMAEAGIELVPYGDRLELGAAMQRILLDKDLWQSLHERSLQAHSRYFSWSSIVGKYCDALALSTDEDRSAENSGTRVGG